MLQSRIHEEFLAFPLNATNLELNIGPYLSRLRFLRVGDRGDHNVYSEDNNHDETYDL